MYGMGKQKLAISLGVSKDEANELIIKYNKKVPFVKNCQIDANLRPMKKV